MINVYEIFIINFDFISIFNKYFYSFLNRNKNKVIH